MAKPVKAEAEERGISLTGLGFNGIGSTIGREQSLRLSAVYAATNMISNSVALLPINIVEVDLDKKRKIKHPLYSVLNGKPDSKLTHFEFFKMMIESLILKGNAYAYIVRDEQLNVTQLRYIDKDYVQPMLQKDGTVKYIVSGIPAAVDAINMIDLAMHRDEMFCGLSIIKYACNALRSAADAEKHSENFFKSGANLSGVLKAQATLTKEQKEQIRDSWVNAFDSNGDRVSVAVLPAGLDYQPISISPEDSQLLDTRKFNVTEIARFFNISPIKLFDYSSTSYSTLEQVQLSYLSDTIMPYIQLIQDEFNLKLFKPSQVGSKQVDFDFSVILATDKDSEVKYYRELLVNGILSYNEVRAKLGFEPMEGGDKHILQMSYASLDDILAGKLIKNQSDNLDNKVKQDEEPVEDKPKKKK